MRFNAQQIIDIKDRNRVDKLAGALVMLRNARASRDFPHGRQVGPCPFCSKDGQSKTDSRFECDGDKWVCAACADGGDVIAFVSKEKGLDQKKDFARILEHLGGVAEVEETPESARRAGGKAFREGKAETGWPADLPPHLRDAWARGWRDAAAAEKTNADFRERERKRLYDGYWKPIKPWRGTIVQRYFERRGLLVPDNARIGYLPDCPMHADGGERAIVVHTGPAMLCPILRPDASHESGERFSGLHFTWLDLNQPKGKAVIVHPDTGEVLPSKKSRGTKQGGYIDLGGCAWREAETVVSGEGNENTLAGYTILMRAGRDVARTNFRCAIDLGNLAGKARDRLPHPKLKTDSGRVRKVPGVVPDLESPAMPLPPRAHRVVWMCDGDSDPFITKCAMQRGVARRERDDLKQVLMWPGVGADWNDVVR
jgi:hypothetical protein